MSRELSIENIFNHPHEFGLPTFEEFVKNKDKWTKGEDWLTTNDAGPTEIRHLIRKIVHVYGKYKTTKPERMARLLEDEGLTLDDVECHHELVPIGGLKCDVHIEYRRKEPEGKIIKVPY